MRAHPSESDLLQGANKTIYLPLFLQVKGKLLDCGEFIKLSFTWADALWTVIWPFPLAAVKEKLFMVLAEDGREDFIQVGTI